jgi:hypothetical protein
MNTKYKYYDPDGIYFFSTAVVYWIDVFTRTRYKDIVMHSLERHKWKTLAPEGGKLCESPLYN